MKPVLGRFKPRKKLIMDQSHIDIAKERVWNRMQSKLPDRGLSPYQNLLTNLKTAGSPAVSRLKLVQAKEHLLDVLPDRVQPAFWGKRLWATGSLLAVLSVIFLPVLQHTPVALADQINTLEVVEGQVTVNGELVSDVRVLQNGDRIETLEGSMAHLYFVDDSRVTLAPSTAVDIVDTQVDPNNAADTRVTVNQSSGRVWVQVLNLVSKDSYFALNLPTGQVKVDSRASFETQLGEGTRISVARNLVEVSLNGDEIAYTGTLGQGAEVLLSGDSLQTERIPEEREEDIWWEFNTAYGKSYASTLDEQYKYEATVQASVLPGDPLYFLKQWREQIQLSLAFTPSAREDVLVEQAQNRLSEAQTLLAKGKTDEAEEVLQDYHDTVDEALQNSDNADLLAALELTQKQVLTDPEVNANTALMEAHLAKSSASVSSGLEEKTQAKMVSTSQKLERVPDLLADGNYEQALLDLSDYQTESLSILTELEEVPMDQREAVVSALLNQKLDDITLLRVIASMPEAAEALDIDKQMLEQMSMMVLSLKEQQLTDLGSFFESTDYDLEVQYNVYSRLKGDVEIDEGLSEQFESVEEELENSALAAEEPLVEIEEVDTSVPHADETQK